MLTNVKRKIAVAAAGGVLLAVGTSGLAVAADGAVPGDLLYGVDLALEKLGVGSGGATERLQEASSLIEHGRVARGLDHVANAIGQLQEVPEIGDAEAALRHAADQVSILRVEDVEGNAATQAFRDQAASLLDLLASELADDGTGRGERVAAATRQFAQTARDFAATIRPDNAPDLADQAQVPEDAMQGSPRDSAGSSTSASP